MFGLFFHGKGLQPFSPPPAQMGSSFLLKGSSISKLFPFRDGVGDLHPPPLVIPTRHQGSRVLEKFWFSVPTSRGIELKGTTTFSACTEQAWLGFQSPWKRDMSWAHPWGHVGLLASPAAFGSGPDARPKALLSHRELLLTAQD